MFKDKILLITGGTGSFGNAVLKRFLNTDIKEIRIFSRDEKKQNDMRNEIKNTKIRYYIGDVRDINSLDYPMKDCDYVFHAAALKQIPSCEFFPMEAVKTNVMGTDNVLSKAIQYGIKKVVCLSTDKSVYPISAMGISKAMMEKIIVAKSRLTNDTIISCARYGNVLASRGSVIPLFVSLIKRGTEITVTDPNMTRFMMSLEDAVELVLFSFKNGQAGDIFVQKAPSASVGQLAKVLLDIFKADNPIANIGIRSGDKMNETLVTKEEYLKADEMDNYFRIKADHFDLSYTIINTSKPNNNIEGYHSHNTHRLSDQELKTMLLKLDYIQQQIDTK